MKWLWDEWKWSLNKECNNSKSKETRVPYIESRYQNEMQARCDPGKWSLCWVVPLTISKKKHLQISLNSSSDPALLNASGSYLTTMLKVRASFTISFNWAVVLLLAAAINFLVFSPQCFSENAHSVVLSLPEDMLSFIRVRTFLVVTLLI